jgi:GTP-binding protein
MVKALRWKGPVYAVSSINGEGTDKLVYDIMDFIEAYRVRLATPDFAESENQRMRQIHEEGRTSIQQIADLRKGSVEDDDYDDDDFDDVEVAYVRE